MCVLAGRLVSERDHIVVTILVDPKFLRNVQSEISRQSLDGHEALQRIR